ncbi:hypothetical protein OAJ29_01215 [Euryarchaeota archaeon]|nr:hypothetical protein [Euryarchaeota archaeon]
MGEEKELKRLEKSIYVDLLKNQDYRCSVCSKPLFVKEHGKKINLKQRKENGLNGFEKLYETDLSSLNYSLIIPNSQGGGGPIMDNLELTCSHKACKTRKKSTITLPLHTTAVLDKVIKLEDRNYFQENNKEVQPAERTAKIRSLINEKNDFNLYKALLPGKLQEYIPNSHDRDNFLTDLEESYRNFDAPNNQQYLKEYHNDNHN